MWSTNPVFATCNAIFGGLRVVCNGFIVTKVDATKRKRKVPKYVEAMTAKNMFIGRRTCLFNISDRFCIVKVLPGSRGGLKHPKPSKIFGLTCSSHFELRSNGLQWHATKFGDFRPKRQPTHLHGWPCRSRLSPGEIGAIRPDLDPARVPPLLLFEA